MLHMVEEDEFCDLNISWFWKQTVVNTVCFQNQEILFYVLCIIKIKKSCFMYYGFFLFVFLINFEEYFRPFGNNHELWNPGGFG